MNDTRTIKVKADAALAQAIAGKHIKRCLVPGISAWCLVLGAWCLVLGA